MEDREEFAIGEKTSGYDGAREKGEEGPFCRDVRRLEFAERSFDIDWGAEERFCVGVGECKVRFTIAIGEPSSKLEIAGDDRFSDMDCSAAAAAWWLRLYVADGVVECPRSNVGESGITDERRDCTGADWSLSTPLSSVLMLPPRLRRDLELNEEVEVFHVTLEGVPGREDTAIG